MMGIRTRNLELEKDHIDPVTLIQGKSVLNENGLQKISSSHRFHDKWENKLFKIRCNLGTKFSCLPEYIYILIYIF